MRKSFGAAGFYNSEFLSDEKNPRDPEILIPAAGFCNSECLSDEKIPPGAPENLIAVA